MRLFSQTYYTLEVGDKVKMSVPGAANDGKVAKIATVPDGVMANRYRVQFENGSIDYLLPQEFKPVGVPPNAHHVYMEDV